MNLRRAIRMSAEEVLQFLDEERTVVCATRGRRGWPHLAPLWYLVRDGEIWCWTYAKSQKVRNLERDPRATLQVEAGETYAQLRGVMLECEAVIHRDPELVLRFGTELADRYPEPTDTPAALERMATKRVALQFVEHRRVSWDHRKLEPARVPPDAPAVDRRS
jgi:PPOX class probable F420-dependent enzyme